MLQSAFSFLLSGADLISAADFPQSDHHDMEQAAVAYVAYVALSILCNP